jgi:GH15 family glucan-1,4-alpha-glucosidase
VGIRELLDWLAEHWDQPEEGIWETRGGRKDFTYGRLMCWMAFDRGIRMPASHGRPAAVGRWTEARDAIYDQILDKGWNPQRQAFVQHYDSPVLDRAGRLEDARLAFEKMLTYANHVGLFSEEIALTGEQIGNFPQAFTHLALIDAAITLDEALNTAGRR